MKPLFMLCPHCSFPVVVHPIEVGSPRRCRQCRGEYVPGALPGKNDLLDGKRSLSAIARTSLRAIVQKQRRSLR